MKILFKASSWEQIIYQEKMIVLKAESKEGDDVFVMYSGNDLDFKDKLLQSIIRWLQNLDSKFLAIGKTASINLTTASFTYHIPYNFTDI